jgi:hypothetical protein
VVIRGHRECFNRPIAKHGHIGRRRDVVTADAPPGHDERLADGKEFIKQQLRLPPALRLQLLPLGQLLVRLDDQQQPRIRLGGLPAVNL